MLDRDKVKCYIIENNLSYTWLTYMLDKHKNINVSNAELTKMLNGTLNTNKAKKVIEASLTILNSYNKWEGRL